MFCEKRYLRLFGHSGTSEILKLDINKTMLYIIMCYKERVLEMDVVLGWDVAQFKLGMFLFLTLYVSVTLNIH